MKDKTEEMSELVEEIKSLLQKMPIEQWRFVNEVMVGTFVIDIDGDPIVETETGIVGRYISLVNPENMVKLLSSLPPSGPQDHVVTGIAGGLAMLQEALNQGDIASAQSLTRSMIYRIDSLPPSGAASETTNLHWLKDHISQAVHDYWITGKRDISAHLEQAFVSLQKAIAVEEGR